MTQYADLHASIFEPTPEGERLLAVGWMTVKPTVGEYMIVNDVGRRILSIEHRLSPQPSQAQSVNIFVARK